MYRILAANQPVRERRNQRSHPCYTKPELVATGPNQTWSWDITRLRGPKRWTSFYLYVLLDIFSPLRRGLDGCRSGERRARRDADRGNLSQARHRAPGAHPAFGPRRADDQQVHRPTPRRPRGHPLSEPPPGQRRQPVLRSAVQDPEVSPRLPWPLRRHYQPPSPSAGRSSPGTTPSTAMPGSRCSPPMMSIITEHRMCWLSADVPCKPAWALHPERFVHGTPKPAPLPEAVWINPPRHFHNRRNESVNRNRRCLKVVDRFRTAPIWGILASLFGSLPIRLTPMTATCRVPPLSRVKLGIGWSRGVARDAEQ